MNINIELFKRYRPAHKVEIIKKLTYGELLNTSIDTLIKCIKEAGVGHTKQQRSHNKSLYLVKKCGNNWNSDVEEVSLYHKKAYIYFYLQYSNTDTTVEARLEDFLKPGSYHGSFTYKDRYANLQTAYFTYDEEDKAKVIKSILLSYVANRYGYKEP